MNHHKWQLNSAGSLVALWRLWFQMTSSPVSWYSYAWEEVVTCWSSSVYANATVEGTNRAFFQYRLLCYHLFFSASLAKTSQHNSSSITKHFLVDQLIVFLGGSINCGLACFKHWSMQSKLELSAVIHKVVLAAFGGTCSLSVSVGLHQWDFLRVWQMIQRVGSVPAEGQLRSEAPSWFLTALNDAVETATRCCSCRSHLICLFLGWFFLLFST